jgi:hypothetical protein
METNGTVAVVRSVAASRVSDSTPMSNCWEVTKRRGAVAEAGKKPIRESGNAAESMETNEETMNPASKCTCP